MSDMMDVLCEIECLAQENGRLQAERDSLLRQLKAAQTRVNEGVETYKRQFLEKLEIVKEDIPHGYDSAYEMYAAEKMLKTIVELV